MKFLIVLCAALACAVAKPQILAPWAIPNGYAYSAAAPWASPLGHPLAYSAAHWAGAPLAYSAAHEASPLAYSAAHHVASPLAYSAAHVAAPIAYSAPVAVAPVAAAAKTQYHAQDELGQASYGHSEPTQTHHAVQDAFGNKVGSFSYAAPDGRILRTDYVADALGYRVSSNALPVAHAGLPLPVQDTPEVAIAKAQHLAAHGVHHSIAKRSVALFQTPASTAPLAYAATPVAYAAAPTIAHHAVAAPLAYSAHHAIAAPVAYSAHHTIAAPVAYSAHHTIAAHHAIAAPVAYSAHHSIAAPVAYSTHHGIAAPVAYSAAPAVVSAGPVLREAVQTTVVNTPGHAVSYRID